MDSNYTPMDILKALSPIGAKTYMDSRVAIMNNPELQALPEKTKLLVGIGVASALQSSTCTQMWTKLAQQAGASDAEIVEAVLVARLMKADTMNDTSAEAYDWLLDQKN